MAIRKLFIANRGEIAVRIVRAAQSLGIATVQGHSEADADMLAVRLADQAVCIGPAPAKASYLNAARIIDAAKASGAVGRIELNSVECPPKMLSWKIQKIN